MVECRLRRQAGTLAGSRMQVVATGSKLLPVPHRNVAPAEQVLVVVGRTEADIEEHVLGYDEEVVVGVSVENKLAFAWCESFDEGGTKVAWRDRTQKASLEQSARY